ncbi:NAD/NADP octopine/nopaline dehydrogenase [Ustulina deusta]|nr:NAD/NADP octopine/nopaline dehydrogenase [Ustulina deusta]
MKIGIVGVGHVGCALAADLESRGFQTTLWAAPGHRKTFDHLVKQNHLDASEAITGRFYPTLTTSFDKLIQSTDEVIIVAVPTTGHSVILKELAKYSLSRYIIIFITGNFVGPVAAAAINAKAIICTSRSPYTSRTEESNTGEIRVRVNGIKKRLEIASFGKLDQPVGDTVTQVFSVPLIWYSNTLKLDLATNHGVVHPPTMLSNIGAIKRKSNLFFYCDCMTAEVCSLILAADKERLAVAAALGFTDMEDVLEMFNADYGTEYADLTMFVQSIDALNKRPGLPSSLQARQISQDIPFWCVPVASLGKALNVQTPVINGWILASVCINQVNYREIGRTLQTFGLRDNASVKEILNVFEATDDSNRDPSSTHPHHLESVRGEFRLKEVLPQNHL